MVGRGRVILVNIVKLGAKKPSKLYALDGDLEVLLPQDAFLLQKSARYLHDFFVWCQGVIFILSDT